MGYYKKMRKGFAPTSKKSWSGMPGKGSYEIAIKCFFMICFFKNTRPILLTLTIIVYKWFGYQS